MDCKLVSIFSIVSSRPLLRKKWDPSVKTGIQRKRKIYNEKEGKAFLDNKVRV